MLLKCCTKYVSKFEKLSSGHRTGKGQFSFQSQSKAVPKNAQTTTQLHSSHTGGSEVKVSACNVRDLGSIPGSGRSPGEGNGYSLQYSCLKHPQGQRSLAGYTLWDRKESGTTERLPQSPLAQRKEHGLNVTPTQLLGKSTKCMCV